MSRKIAIILAAAAILTCVSSGKAQVTIETVIVGHPGNRNDKHGERYGGVGYAYNIGKYEVTAGQYTSFLNAVAADDVFGLYHESMDADGGMIYAEYGCNIKRSESSSGSYTYSVAADWADRPVNFVSWGDAARFANWLHNRQPTGAQDLTTTEDGAYDLNGATNDAMLLAVVRKPDATWVIPSEDEWYKAAYHYNGGGWPYYWDFPTGSDTLPTAELPPGTDMANGSANYRHLPYAGSLPYYRTEVGAYDAKPSPSPYGTFDQGGNVWEWNETVIDGVNRGWRGGAIVDIGGGGSYGLKSTSRRWHNPTFEFFNTGFRLVELSEARAADLDGDGDVDTSDFRILQAQYTGDLDSFVSFQAYLGGPR